MKKLTLLIITLIILFWLPSLADTTDKPENYCKDQARWQQWHELLAKHPQDDAIYALYAPWLSQARLKWTGQQGFSRICGKL